jgi:hypothetical protein
MKFYLLLATGLCLALGACTREKTPEPVCIKDTVYVTQRHSWRAHPDFKLTFKCIYNSVATDESLFLYGPAVIAQLDTGHAVETFSANWYYAFLKQPINKDFFVEVCKPNQVMNLRVTKDPVMSGSQQLLHFSVIDPSFRRLGMDGISNLDEVTAISSQNQLLVPAYTRADSVYERLAFYLIGVKLNPWGNSYAKADTTSFKKIFLKGAVSMNNAVMGISSYYGKFFVCGDATTLLIRPDGTYKKWRQDCPPSN